MAMTENEWRSEVLNGLVDAFIALGALSRGDAEMALNARTRLSHTIEQLRSDHKVRLAEEADATLTKADAAFELTPFGKTLVASIAHEEAKEVTGRCEITLAALLEDSNWAQVFADESYGNVTKAVSVAPPQAAVSDDPPSRSDVLRIVAAVNGENDESEWIGVFELRDGRYLVASGGCDYTGWDCQAHNSLIACASMADVLVYGLTKYERSRLGLPEPESKAVPA